MAREAFGDFVFEHLLNTAHQEQVIFDNTTVTDWELARYFERVWWSSVVVSRRPGRAVAELDAG